MKKIIKKYGNSFVISFTSEEMRIYNIKENDVIDITITKISELKRRRKK